MTDRYQHNPDIHDEWAPPAHRCENCCHVVAGTLAITHEDGSTEERERFVCMRDDRVHGVERTNHCNYWEEGE